MASSPVPPPTLPSLEKSLGLTLNVSGTLPGEALLVELVKFAELKETRMDPALVKRLDAILVQQAEDLQKLWRGLFVKAGILPAE